MSTGFKMLSISVYEQRNHIIYKIKCPGCNDCYIGTIEICLIPRITEHGSKATETKCLNISWNKKCLKIVIGCIPFCYYSMKMNTTCLWHHTFNTVLQNHEMLESNCNWYQLAFLDMFYPKNQDPIIDHGLNASKKLLLFN